MAKQTPPALITWLDARLAERGWSDNELAKRARLNSSTISRLRSGTAPGHEACDAIAQALGVDTEIVFRLAGHLPKPRDWTPDLDELQSLFVRLDEQARQDTLRIVRALAEGRARKNGRQK